MSEDYKATDPDYWFSQPNCTHSDKSPMAVAHFAHELACDMINIYGHLTKGYEELLPASIRDFNRDADNLFLLLPSTVGITVEATRDKSACDYDRLVVRPGAIGKWSGTCTARTVRHAAYELRSRIGQCGTQGSLRYLNGDEFCPIDPESTEAVKHLRLWKRETKVQRLLELQAHMLVEHRFVEDMFRATFVTIEQIRSIVGLEQKSMTRYSKEWGQPATQRSGQRAGKYSLHLILAALRRQFPQVDLEEWLALIPEKKPTGVKK